MVDDLRARQVAMAMGLRVLGTAGLLLFAHAQGLPVDVRATLDEMRGRGFRLAEAVYQEIVQRLEEADT